MTVRDLLVHRSGLGLGAGDLLLWPESIYSRREIVVLGAKQHNLRNIDVHIPRDNLRAMATLACAVGAITGAKQVAHAINPELCTRCGMCKSVCKFDAVRVA